jgi:hypothetical protein
MVISLKKLSQSLCAVSLLSSPFVHAADATTNTTITATVKNPTQLVAEYVRKNTVYANKDNDGLVMGILSVSGYAPQTPAASLRFTDAGGVSNRLTFTNTVDSTKSFQAKMLFNGRDNSPFINNGGLSIHGDLPDPKTDFHIKIHNKKPIPAGQYSDIISVTLVNQ